MTDLSRWVSRHNHSGLFYGSTVAWCPGCGQRWELEAGPPKRWRPMHPSESDPEELILERSSR